MAFDLLPNGTVTGINKQGDHGSGKWTAISKTSASMTEDNDPDVTLLETSGPDELVAVPSGEAPIKFKRQP
jgi:hypothetical protein